MKINYIVTVYLGPRRSKVMKLVRQLNILYHVERHLEAIKTLNSGNIDRITFVINDYDEESTKMAVELIGNTELPIDKKVIVRENTGFSYAAWECALLDSLDGGFDYAFLIEDDYVPINADFIRIFLNERKNDTFAFICQLWRNGHASISNGLFAYSAIEKLYSKRKELLDTNKSIFKLHLGTTYDAAIFNQVHYLDYLKEIGLQFADVTKVSNIPFLESDGDILKIYGNVDKPAYIDINSPDISIKYRYASLDDCETINRIRNSYAPEFLHDSRTFTLEETKKWFTECVGKDLHYVMICCNDVSIGYFRISRYSKLHNNCYIGADIDSRFTGFGLAYTAYMGFLPALTTLDIFESKLYKVSLEVLRTNERAIKLYKKLEFTEEGVKHGEVLKNGKYIDSIIMTKIL